ncbi:MAG TPA: hypothetical protein VHE35_28500 [Kofleriaceae bacterium]|nr:hypothetical protein [Kofleriaceae bacterium]
MKGHFDGDVFVLQVVVLVWLLGWAARALIRIAQGDTRTVLVVQIVFVLFCGGPMVLDLTYGPPEYSYQWGFIVSQYDRTTNLIYLGYLTVIPVLLELFGGRRPAGGVVEPIVLELRPWPRAIAWGAMLLLPASLLLAPDPSAYLTYASALREPTAQGSVLYYLVIAAVAVLAIIGSVLVLAARGTRAIERVLAAPLLALALWTHGKRSSVALAALLLLYLLWMRGILRGTRFIGVALALGVGLATFSYLYQTRIRDVRTEDLDLRSKQASTFYVNMRIDYGRDAVIKEDIYAELHPDRLKILDYRGESLVFYSLFFVPRSMWPGKPYPYAVYVTAAMMRAPLRDYRWGVTTSVLDEAIANFGWIGMLVGPLIPARVCAVGDRRRSPFVAILTVTIASLLIVLHAVAFIPLILLWILLVWRTRVSRATPAGTRVLAFRS